MALDKAVVGQILIPVDDLDRGIHFYRDILGLPFLFTAPPQMAFFMCGPVRLLVGVHSGERAQLRGSMIYFKVDDIVASWSQLRERGVEFQANPHLVHRAATHQLWLAEFKDADGNDLALMSEVPVA